MTNEQTTLQTDGLAIHDALVRFYIFDENLPDDDGDIEGGYRETGETEFLAADGIIEYERHIIRENGVAQICLIKNPFAYC